MKGPRAGWVVLALAFLWPAAAPAQVTTALVQGLVRDESGAPVGGATVTARHSGTGATRSADTSASGSYRIAALPVGPYEVTAGLAGFASEVRSGVTLRVGQEAILDFVLKVAAVIETVTVQGEPPIVETTQTAIATTITTKQIDELPLLNRSFTSLAFLTPGIQASRTEGSIISAAGGSGSSNTLLIDGVSNDAQGLGGFRGDFSPDAIAEFQVLSSQFAAEFGQASGAIVNVLTRSGTNALHGRASGFYRADELSANDPFAEPDPATGTVEKTPFSQKIFSGFLSGPLKKEKTFFFASYEHTFRDDTAVITVDRAVLAALGQSTETSVPQPFRQPRVLAKIDHQLTSDQTLSLRYRLDRASTENLAVGGVFTTEFGLTQVLKNQDFALSHTWLLSPKVVNEARFQFARQSADIPSVNCPGCPHIIRPSVTTGKFFGVPQSSVEDRFQFVDSLSFNVLDKGGDHYFKVGVDFSHVELPLNVPQFFEGLFIFQTDKPFNAADPTTYPLLYREGRGDPRFETKNNTYGVFLQDQWRVMPHLTLNLGVRWDYEDHPSIEQDKNNFAPRLHFAWDPGKDGKTSVRGGFGTYYDQIFLNVPGIALFFAPGRFTITDLLFPGFPNPRVGGLGIPLPNPPPSVSFLDPDNQTPYTNTGSLGFQRELAEDLALSVDAVYARGHNLLLFVDANAPPGAGRPRPDPKFGQVFSVQTRGVSKYKAIQAGLQKRFSQGYSLNLAYTLADNKSDTDSHRGFVSDSNNPDADFGPSLNDSRHTMNGAATVDGPWGIKVGLGGTYLSAPPYDITSGKDDNGDGNFSDRPPGVGHNSARGSDLWTVNARLAKVFPIKKAKVEAIVEAFNAFNHKSAGSFVGNKLSPEFGQPTGTVPGFDPRQVQLGLRIEF